MSTFSPKPQKAKKTIRHINYTCDPARYAELEWVARSAGIGLKELLRQMVDFSLANMTKDATTPATSAAPPA